jgi:hypothetical protein
MTSAMRTAAGRFPNYPAVTYPNGHTLLSGAEDRAGTAGADRRMESTR